MIDSEKPKQVQHTHCPTWQHVKNIMSLFDVATHVCVVEALPDNRGFNVEVYECLDA